MRKFVSVLVAMLLAGAGILAAAAPAQAATINGCKVYNVCLYDWINHNYASGFWQRDGGYFEAASDGGVADCVNLSNHQWHDLNGSPNGTASSAMVNWGPNSNPNVVVKVEFYDYLSCNSSGYSFFVLAAPNELIQLNNLNSVASSCDGGDCGLAWENRISSIKVDRYSS